MDEWLEANDRRVQRAKLEISIEDASAGPVGDQAERVVVGLVQQHLAGSTDPLYIDLRDAALASHT